MGRLNLHDRVWALVAAFRERLSILFRDHQSVSSYELDTEPWIELTCACKKSARVVLSQRCGCPQDPWCGHMPHVEVLSASCPVWRRYARRNGQELAALPKARAR